MTDLKQLAQNLRNYNAWRRGDGKNANIEMPHPIDLGTWIDSAIAVVEAHAKSNVLARRVETPSSHWSADGKPDPHGKTYDCERAGLHMSNMTDDELANGAFLNYDQPLNVAGVLAGTCHSPIAWMTAVKDRIRWLSRSLEKVAAERDALAAELKSLREQMPVGIVDEGDDGVFADLETTSGVIVKLGDKIYARPVPCQDTADMVNKAFQDGINSGYAQAMEEEIARSRQVDPSTLPERDESKPAESQGLFRKFEVRRVDGSDKPGGKHHGCRYFVLDLDHDQHADAAMAAYAQACKNTHPALSAELEAQYPSEHPTKFFCHSEDIGYQEFGTLDGAITATDIDTTYEEVFSEDRYKAVRVGLWWRIKIGDGTATYGMFYSRKAAEEMAGIIRREFLNCAFAVRSRESQLSTLGRLIADGATKQPSKGGD